MKKLRLQIELQYDDKMWHSNDEEKDWFFNRILNGHRGDLLLHSNEVGDQVGTVKVLTISKFDEKKNPRRQGGGK